MSASTRRGQLSTVLGFFLLTYLFSWPAFLFPVENSLLDIFSVAGPTLAAIIMVVAVESRAHLDRLFAPLFQGRAAPGWYGLTLCFHPLVAAIAVLILLIVRTSSADSLGNVPWATLPALLLGRLVINVWEEVGWRGYALPRLQVSYNAFIASLIIGLLWGLWHLPLYFLADGLLVEVPPLLYFSEFVVVSIIYTWLYNSTNGSLFFVTVFHVLGNVTTLAILETELPFTAFLLIRLLLLGLFSIGLIIRYGPARLSRKG